MFQTIRKFRVQPICRLSSSFKLGSDTADKPVEMKLEGKFLEMIFGNEISKNFMKKNFEKIFVNEILHSRNFRLLGCIKYDPKRNRTEFYKITKSKI